MDGGLYNFVTTFQTTSIALTQCSASYKETHANNVVL